MLVKVDMPYSVYILRTNKNTLYIGQAKNLEKRLLEHRSKSKRSAKYMRMFDGFQLVYSEKQPTVGDALKREYELKQLTRAEKEKLISN